MHETCWEILKRDIAAIGTNLTGNLIGFIVSMVCCVLVFLFIQEKLSNANARTGVNSTSSIPSEISYPIPDVLTLDAPYMEENLFMHDMFSFPMVTDVRNNSIAQEQRAAITHPMLQRRQDRHNQLIHPEYIDRINYPDKQQGDMPREGYSLNDHRIKYKPLSEL